MNILLHSPWLAANLERMGWTLLHFLWQGALVAVLLGLAMVVLRRAPARSRYLTAVVATAAAMLMPLFTFAALHPAAQKRALPVVMTRNDRTTVAVTAPPAPLQTAVEPAHPPQPVVPRASLQPVRHAPLSSQTRSTGSWQQIGRKFLEKMRLALPWCVAAWALGVSVLSVRLLVGWTHAQRLYRQGTRFPDPQWQASLERLAHQLGIRRVVRLLESTLAEVPAVVGTLRPVILLPVGMLTGLSMAQVEMILAHELAHIRRQDYLVNLGLALFETLGFYHPAVWWIAARVREEREHACDDLALDVTGDDRLGYAQALATLEEMRGPAAGVAMAATSGGRGTLLARVRRLLGVVPETKPGSARNVGWLAGALALLITSALLFGGFKSPARAQAEAKPAASPTRQRVALPTDLDELTGRVVDEAGKPVAGAWVYDALSHYGNIELPPGPIITDAHGIFRVPKLKYPGQWRFIGARSGDESIGWLDIGAGRQPAAFGTDNVLTQPIVLRPRKYDLRGTCVDEQGNPVVGATVAVTALPTEGSGYFNWQSNHPEDPVYHFWEALTTRSDAEGKFSLPVPLAEGMLAEIRAEGRQTVYPFHSRQANVWPKIDLGKVTLTGAGRIAGRIGFASRPGGEPRPLQGALLMAVNADDLKAATLIGPQEYENAPYSDEQGRYQIEHLPPGTYTVYFYGLGIESPGQPLPRMAAVENVIVRAGEMTPLDLSAVPGRQIRVRAVDPDTNQPAQDLPVHFVGPSRPASTGLTWGDATSDHGECTFQVAPGHYRVFILDNQRLNGPALASAEVEVPTDRDPDMVLLKVQTGPQLRGKVQDAQGKPIPLGGETSVLLLETSPTPSSRQGGGVSSDGTFDIPLTKTGIRARLAVDVAGFHPFLSPEFAVTATSAPMTVTLETAADFVIRGHALDQDGQPIAHGYVTGTIFPADGLSYSVQLGNGIPEDELYTDQDGWFETHRIRAGAKFHLDVFAGGKLVTAASGWTQLPEVSEPGRFDIEMHPVPITRAAVPDVPIGPRDLAGHVVDAQGRPVEGAAVTVSGAPSFREPGGATTNAAGGFRLPDFGDRTYVYLAVTKEGYATHWVTDLTVGKDFVIPLENRTRLRGQFVLPDASPAGRAHIVLRTSRPTTRAFMMNPIGDLRVDRDTDERGAYDFPVEAGEYSAEITSADGSLVARHERITVAADQSGTLPATLSAGLTLRVQTVDRVTGQPVAGLKFSIDDNSDAAALGTRPASERVTDAQGFATWEHLLPGLTILRKDQTGIYQRFWSQDSRDESPLNPPADRVPTGNEGTYFELVLRPTPERAGEPIIVQVERGVKVFGEVQDAQGKPAFDVSISAFADRPSPPGEKYPSPAALGPLDVYEQNGVFSGYIAAGNGVPSRLSARPQEDGQGVTHSEAFDSQPGDERHFTIRLNKGGVIEGTVLDKQGHPLSDVSVSGTPLDFLDFQGARPWAKSDAQGRFRFEHVRPTEYEITTTIVPHMSVGDEPPQEKRRVAVAAGEHVELDPLHFDPSGWTPPPSTPPPAEADANVIVGQVVDAQGKGVAGVTVFDYDPGNEALTPTALTDAAGTFRLPIKAERRAGCRLIAQLGNKAVGWTARAAGLSPLITLRARTLALDGEFTDTEGHPLAGVHVQVGALDDPVAGYLGRDLFHAAPTERLWSVLTATSDAQGHFQLQVPEKVARHFEFTHPSYVTQRLYELPVNGHFGRIVLVPGGTVAGSVLLSPGNSPLADASVFVSKARDNEENGALYGNAQTSMDGSYVVSGLAPGEYTVTLGPRHRGQRAAVAVEHVSVRAGAATAGIDLHAGEGRTINVEVVDAVTGKPFSGAGVSCYGPSQPRAAGSLDTVGGDGREQFIVTPGKYYCCVLVPKGNERTGLTIDVPADPGVPVPPVRLTVGADTPVRGVIRLRDGGPVPPGMEINLVQPPGERLTGSRHTLSRDHRGNEQTYTYDGLPAGSHVSVVVDAPGCRPWLSEVFTVAQGMPELTAILEPAEVAPLRGKIVDHDGKPVVGAGIRALLTVADGQCSLPLGLDGADLRTDAEGRFETRRLRVGDTFTLWAHDERDSSGQISTNFTATHLENRRQASSLPLTIPNTLGLTAPTLTLEPLVPANRPKHSGLPNDPYTAEDRERQLKALAALGSVDDPSARQMLSIVLMTSHGEPPTAAEQAVVARFLDSNNIEVLGMAVYVFSRVKDPAILPKLKAAVPRLIMRSEDAIGLAERLHLAGDDEALDGLAARLRDPATPADQRRVLSFQLLPSSPRRFASLYVDLLTDTDPAVRTNVLGRLRALADGETFGFDPARTPADQNEPIGRWQAWLAKSGSTLPTEYPSPNIPVKPATAWIGIRIHENPDGSGIIVQTVLSDSPAQRAGLRPGDNISAVDGQSVAGQTAAEVSARQLLGAAGTPAKLTVQRQGVPKVLDITVIRETIPVAGAIAPPTGQAAPTQTADSLTHSTMNTDSRAVGKDATPGPPASATPATSSTPAQPVATVAASRTLIFHVVERDTKKPIPDAELRILRNDPTEENVSTDAGGVCVISLAEPPRQTFCVRVKKPGFVPMRVDWHLNQPAFNLPTEYTLPLEPGTTIGGTILNEEGQPVPNATVILILRGSSMGGQVEEVFPDIWEERVTTDARGKWKYDAAPSVLRYPSIAVEHPDYVRHDDAGGENRPTTESLRDGSAVIRLRHGVKVEGRVTDVAGKGIADAVILPGDDRMSSDTKPEYHTNADGQFVIAHALPGAVTLTIKAEGHAPEIIDANFSAGMEPLQVTLQPGRVLRMRVVDSAGKGLAGVMAAADTWRGKRTLETCLESDADGRIEWKSAPPDAVQYDFLKEGYQAARNVTLTASAEEQTVTLRKPLLVSGAVTDAQSGQPVREFRVITGVATPNKYLLWARAASRPGSDGRYVQAFDEPAALKGQHLLRVEAEGYHSAISRQIDDSEGRVTLDFSLEPGGASTGNVVAPDGSPAAGATIAVVFPGDPAQVQNGVLLHNGDHVKTSADARGHFQFPSQESPYLVVVTHPTGFAHLTAEEFAAHPDVHLTAWGRVEVAVSPGVIPASEHQPPFYLDDQPAGGSGPASGQPMVYFDYRAKLEENGAAIIFDKVPPGDWRFGRYGQANNYARPVQVRPGETAHLSLLGERSITGRLNIAAISEKMDLTQCDVQVSLKTPPPPVPAGLVLAERQAWFAEWFKTTAGEAYQSAARTYRGKVEADGVFRCDGIPAGKEYDLRIMLLKPGQDPQKPRVVLYCSKPFLLPEGKGACNLGDTVALSPSDQGM